MEQVSKEALRRMMTRQGLTREKIEKKILTAELNKKWHKKRGYSDHVERIDRFIEVWRGYMEIL